MSVDKWIEATMDIFNGKQGANMKPVAECLDCKTMAVVNNAPSVEVPTPIYGPLGMKAHEGHDIRVNRRVKP